MGGNASYNVSFQGGTAGGLANAAIFLRAEDNSNGSLQVSDFAFDGGGVRVNNFGNSVARLGVSGTRITNSPVSAFTLDLSESAELIANLNQNTIANSSQDGIHMELRSTEEQRAVIRGNQLAEIGSNAIQVITQNDKRVIIFDSQIASTGSAAVRIDQELAGLNLSGALQGDNTYTDATPFPFDDAGTSPFGGPGIRINTILYPSSKKILSQIIGQTYIIDKTNKIHFASDMNKRRCTVKENDGYYHCMSRTVDGQRLFGEAEKEVLRKMIRQVADFSGVNVLTYCVLSNHFHVLIRVGLEAKQVSDEELLRRYQVLYPKPTRYQRGRLAVLEKTLSRGGPEANSLRKKLLGRMGDISEYMKTLKQRFSVHFNHKHDRFGPLWAERFKSILIEPERKTIRTVAAYIDLNPVRAGLVADPKDYRFCGYAEAVAGSRIAREGLIRATEGYAANPNGKHLQGYRMTLFGTGSRERENDAAIPREEAVRVVEKERGKLPLAALLRCRVRYFTDGLVLGSAEYIRQIGAEPAGNRNRQDLPIQEDDWPDLRVAKGFRGPILK